MAVKINAGEINRSDLISIFPENIFVDESINGRQHAHDDDSVLEMAQSLLDYGQEQPVVVRKIDDHKVQLVLGYRRWKAANLINKTLRPKEPIKLDCRVINGNEEEAFIHNLIENHHRRECSPIDHAFNHRRLREVYKWDEPRIAKLYNRSLAWVSQIKDLLSLDAPQREAVAKGDMAVNTARDIAKLPSAERAKVVADATENGHVDPAKVRDAIRGKGVKKPLTLAELKKFLDGFTADDSSAGQRELANGLLHLIAGKASEKVATKLIERLLP